MMTRIAVGALVAAAVACGGDAKKTTTPTPPPPTTIATKSPAATAPPPTCKRKNMFGPFKNLPETYAKRKGVNATKLSQVPTTKNSPIEACGLRQGFAMLFALRCDDGSAPFADMGALRRARVGSVGRGGRCGGIIDKYAVRCPAKTHMVFVDSYFCGGDTGP